MTRGNRNARGERWAQSTSGFERIARCFGWSLARQARANLGLENPDDWDDESYTALQDECRKLKAEAQA